MTRHSILGDGLLERARSTTFALLGVTAAVGLGIVAMVLNQDWPLVAGGPIPGATHQAVGDASVAATAKGRILDSSARDAGSRRGSAADRPDEAPAPSEPRPVVAAQTVVSDPTPPPSDSDTDSPGTPEAAPAPVPVTSQPVSAPPAGADPVSVTPPTGASAPEQPASPQSPTTAVIGGDEQDQSSGQDRGSIGHSHDPHPVPSPPAPPIAAPITAPESAKPDLPSGTRGRGHGHDGRR